jgi:two-component system C4-dicarboxylate transport sensor histidine kinase DctB
LRKLYNLLILLLCAALLGCGAYVVGANEAKRTAHETSLRKLQIVALDLEATLQRFETLPYALSLQPESIKALQQPSSPDLIASFNRTLRDIQRQAKVSAVYLMNSSGDTVATSNWDTEQDYTGKNFGFRPYFLDAMNGNAGRFYAIGSTTREPGYFIAQPVYATPERHSPIGVMAVKISLDDMVQNWKKFEDPLVLVDRWGVVFLSNRDEWRYHSISALSETAKRDIQRFQQYMDHAIPVLADVPEASGVALGQGVDQTVGHMGWRLVMYPAQGPVVRAGAWWALFAILFYAIAWVTVWAVYQRKRRLEERRLAREALHTAHEDLERKIALRTHDLTLANETLAEKYQRLKETELLLRSTQSELIQAGKLAMLGQMAAGVTHELNQPLTALRAFADNALVFLAGNQYQRVGENLTRISAASERMGRIIGQLKGFARKSDALVDTIDMASAIRNSALLLDSDFKRSRVGLSLSIETVAHVTGDSVRVEQVLINLMRNALDAVRDAVNPKVEVTLTRHETECQVRIRDFGPGISQEAEDHMFEPFFSTKTSGGGLGLGLAISSSIVQALNGRLTARNHPEGGAEFSLSLPLVQREMASRQNSTNNEGAH